MRYGRRVGAVVPAEVTERFEHWEDIYWSRRAAEVLDRNNPTVPWEEAARLATTQQTRTQHSVHHSVSTRHRKPRGSRKGLCRWLWCWA
ncbi:MAG: hypothetical protein ACRDQ4_00795 [Pseudonocardiaceae bacterium]